MEWVAHLAGEQHSSTPACVSPFLREFAGGLNDALPDEPRQRLRPYLGRMIGTADDGLDEKRAWMATDWLIRTYTPAWLSLAGLGDHATGLRSLLPVLGPDGLACTTSLLRAARSQATDIWTADQGPSTDAAMTAAWAAASAAADAAGGGAAGAAARDAGGGLGREAVWTARDAARAAAWACVKDTARYTAWEALAPTVTELQDSAFALLDRMLPTIPVRLPAVADAPVVFNVELIA
jgi:hypothetical protein